MKCLPILFSALVAFCGCDPAAPATDELSQSSQLTAAESDRALVGATTISWVERLIHFGDDRTLEGAELLGPDAPLAALIPHGHYFDTESSEASLRVTYPEGANAKELAEAIWFVLSGDERFHDVDCGSFGFGGVSTTGVQEFHGDGARPHYTRYHIDYTGDGGMNTCSGSGGPGWASYRVDVYLKDQGTRSARVELYSGEE